MTTLQIIITIIGAIGLIIAVVSLIGANRNYSSIIPFSLGGALFLLALIAFVIALIFGGCNSIILPTPGI